jgi:signal transduction histidine kinase
MTVARASAEILGRRPDDPNGVLKHSDRIVKSIDRTDRMIEDLLDANRIRAGESLPLKLSEFDLTELIRNTLEELSAIHGKRFALQAPTPVVGVWSKQDLRRVLENLIGNAIKYGDRDRAVTVNVAKQAGGRAIVSVQNFGNPIAKEEQSTLFKQFRRTSGAVEGAQKGWGLGLTLARGIVEAHGGEIDVESDARRGTTFKVVLPLKSRAA